MCSPTSIIRVANPSMAVHLSRIICNNWDWGQSLLDSFSLKVNKHKANKGKQYWRNFKSEYKKKVIVTWHQMISCNPIGLPMLAERTFISNFRNPERPILIEFSIVILGTVSCQVSIELLFSNLSKH